jgi:IMP dehydrogenase
MQVKNLMTPLAGYAEPDMLVRDAAARMKELDLDPLPVARDGHLVGMLTSSAIDVLMEQDGLRTGMRHVREIMSDDYVCCSPDQSVAEAADFLEANPDEARLGRVPVVDGEGRLVGIVSVRDIRERDREEDDGVTAAQAVNSVDTLVDFDQDRVAHMSDESFPASDPPAPQSGEQRQE